MIVIGSGAGGGTPRAHGWPRRASASCCSSGAGGCPGSRKLARAGRVRRGRYVWPDTWYYQRRLLSARGALLRRRRDQALRRRPVPAGERTSASSARAGSRRPGRSPTRTWSLVHQGGAALPGPRRARRGPDRAALERAVPVPGRPPRAADPAALGRLEKAGLHPFHAPCGIMLNKGNMPYSRCVRCPTATGSRASSTPSRTPR